MYDRKKELTLFLHGDGVLGKLIRALEEKRSITDHEPNLIIYVS